METDPKRCSILIREEALRLGFDDCGISAAGKLDREETFLNRWLEEGRHACMGYMERNRIKRTDPGKLVAGARSVISVLVNYYPPRFQEDPSAPVVSKYAYYPDYHGIIKSRLHLLLDYIDQHMGPVKARIFVDSAPVLERAWAARSGLGWIGKNTLLISRKCGSFVFLGEIICDLELAPGKEIPDYCGQCTRCIDACPTGALLAPRLLDASRCISYHTIENRGEIPESMHGKMQNRIFGCDICQDVCPWNRKVRPTSFPGLEPVPGLLEMTTDDWEALDETTFSNRFTGTSLERTGYRGIKRNLKLRK
ncbi:MAG TPA: tRNA epoxyqueuosine(34) reductase QueG [Bacteroidetes bacterium]|mgnify:CR=1 FL=1|nr:tRNA epoxyqueuosine(34) reductase QueG [Bacteroidota bacterium]